MIAFLLVRVTTETSMGSITNKAKGYANQVAGNVKQGVGKAVGSDKLKASGTAQEIKGEAQVGLGKIKDVAKEGHAGVDKAVND